VEPTQQNLHFLWLYLRENDPHTHVWEYVDYFTKRGEYLSP